MHILKSLKSTGKAAVILPHGVLFRGNAEATIRKTIIDKGYIKGIIVPIIGERLFRKIVNRIRSYYK